MRKNVGGGDGGRTVFRLHCLRKESMFNQEGIKDSKTNKRRKMIFKSYQLEKCLIKLKPNINIML